MGCLGVSRNQDSYFSLPNAESVSEKLLFSESSRFCCRQRTVNSDQEIPSSSYLRLLLVQYPQLFDVDAMSQELVLLLGLGMTFFK